MKLRAITAVLGVLAAGPASSAVFNLGTLDMTKPLYHAFVDFTGDFTDIYTFTLGPEPSASVVGDTTTINFGNWWNVKLTSATLSGGGLSQTLVDTNPNDGFSFHGVTGGNSYSLSINGTVAGTGLMGVTGIYAGHVSAVPEPEALGLALVGLLATGAALRRRRSH
ncbi:MAG: FxDxF family PEP-CTERM protein [Pseudomonadota bacterium]